MVSISYQGRLTTGPASHLVGITDLDIISQGGISVLYSASGPTGGVSGFALGPGAPVFLDGETYGPGQTQATPGQLEALSINNAPVLVTLGRYETALECFDLASNGQIAGTGFVTTPGGFTAPMVALAQLDQGADTLVFASQSGDAAISTYRSDGSGALSLVWQQTSTSQTQGADIGAMQTVRINGADFLITASGFRDTITAYQVSTTGVLTQTGEIGSADGLGIDAPSAMAQAQIGTDHFIIVASPLSHSLSVLQLDAAGALQATDHVMDSGLSQLGAVSALESITLNGQVFVVAAGGDGGLSLMQLLPGGRLTQLGRIENTTQIDLPDVTALALHEQDGTIEIFASSESSAGIVHLRVDPGAIETPLIGDAGNNALTGGAGRDLIEGGAGNDTLDGGAGDDVLRDGAGMDVLRGGAGADLFVLQADGQTDRIEGFEAGVDKLDLSELGYLRNIGQLDIQSTFDGARISFGDEVIEIVSDDFNPLEAADFSTDDLLNLDHLLILANPNLPSSGDDSLSGTSGSDNLSGQEGNDLLVGLDGADVLDGGLGDDTLDGGLGQDVLIGGFGNDVYRLTESTPGSFDRFLDAEGEDLVDFSGFGASVLVDLRIPETAAQTNDTTSVENAAPFRAIAELFGIENIIGTDFNDLIIGEHSSSGMDGGLGSDTLIGGFGDDVYMISSSNPGDFDRLLDADGHNDLGDFSGFNAAVSIDLRIPSVSVFTNDTDTAIGGTFRAIGELVGIENIKGTDFNDLIIGEGSASGLDGGLGSDTIIGGFGDDSYRLSVSDPGTVDRFLDGAGEDFVDFSGFDRAVFVDLTQPSTAARTNDTADASGSGTMRVIAEVVGIEKIAGTKYHDHLIGEGSSNVIDGGAGDDTLEGGGGHDRIDGGEGSDIFVFRDNFDRDTLSDFDALDDDEKIDFSDLSSITDFADLVANHMTQTGGHVTINAGGGHIVTLRNTDINDLMDGNDFIF